MTSENQTPLLEEYKSCDALVGRLDTLMWQLAAIIFPISLAGLTFFGVSSNHTADQFATLVVVGTGSVALILTWFFLSRQWYGYQKLAFYRMREIEAALGLWHYRYAGFIRLSGEKRKPYLEQIDEQEKTRFYQLSGFMGDFPHFGLRRSITIITILFVAGWLTLVIREFILTFL